MTDMGIVYVGGPMFEPDEHEGMIKIKDRGRGGAHYSVWYLDHGGGGKTSSEAGMKSLRELFPNGEADDCNFVLFSTSGVHGSYLTIEEIEASLRKFGDDFEPGDGEPEPDDWELPELTVLVVHPRLVCLRCGNVRVRSEDIPYLKKLRESSLRAVGTIGL